MKKTQMSLAELAQHTYQGLKAQGIEVTLSGGACVSIYTENAYQSGDLDFIGQVGTTLKEIEKAMTGIGFSKQGRHFVHPNSKFFVEFPAPPLSIGDEPPRSVHEYPIRTSLGSLAIRMLSPTDCVKDRLCGYYYWNDLQSLEQALMVARKMQIDIHEVERWSRKERMMDRYHVFRKALER